MADILLVFVFYLAASTFCVLTFWALVIRFGDVSDLDPDSFLVKLFSKKQIENAKGSPKLQYDESVMRESGVEFTRAFYRSILHGNTVMESTKFALMPTPNPQREFILFLKGVVDRSLEAVLEQEAEQPSESGKKFHEEVSAVKSTYIN